MMNNQMHQKMSRRVIEVNLKKFAKQMIAKAKAERQQKTVERSLPGTNFSHKFDVGKVMRSFWVVVDNELVFFYRRSGDKKDSANFTLAEKTEDGNFQEGLPSDQELFVYEDDNNPPYVEIGIRHEPKDRKKREFILFEVELIRDELPGIINLVSTKWGIKDLFRYMQGQPSFATLLNTTIAFKDDLISFNNLEEGSDLFKDLTKSY